MNDTVRECIERMHDTFDRTDLDIEWKKIEQKLGEARYAPGDLEPIADCIIALLLAARSNGYDVDSVFSKIESVAHNHLDTKWKKMPDGTYRGM